MNKNSQIHTHAYIYTYTHIYTHIHRSLARKNLFWGMPRLEPKRLQQSCNRCNTTCNFQKMKQKLPGKRYTCVCVCMYMFMYGWYIYIYIYIYIHTYIHICIHAYHDVAAQIKEDRRYAESQTLINTHTYIQPYIHTYIHTYIQKSDLKCYVYMYVCMYVCRGIRLR